MHRARRPLIATRYAIARLVRAGDHVIDATVGNGYDTALLARLVGRSGRVVGFDVQEQAIRRTSERLEALGLAARVTLLQRGHEDLGELTRGLGVTRIRCAAFNLGYLPGSDKSVITRADTTVRAISAACDLLVENGLVTIMAYPGHNGGREESAAVDSLCTVLLADGFEVTPVHAPEPDRVHAPYAYHVVRPVASRTNNSTNHYA